MTVPASDERPHAAGREELWEESWQLDLARPEGVGGFVRLGLWPNLGVAWWWTCLLVPGRPLVAVRDHEVPLPRVGLEVRTEGLWADVICETPLEHWSIGLEAFGVAFDDPSEAWAGEWGERLAVGLDLEWELLGPPVEGPGPGPAGDPAGAYVQPGRVQGELLVGTGRIDFDGAGLWAHRWGPADWWGKAGPTGDLSRYWIGLVGPDGALDSFAVPGDGRRPVEATVLGVAPVLLTGPAGRRARLARALCRAPKGVAAGWAEWLLGG